MYANFRKLASEFYGQMDEISYYTSIWMKFLSWYRINDTEDWAIIFWRYRGILKINILAAKRFTKFYTFQVVQNVYQKSVRENPFKQNGSFKTITRFYIHLI